MPTTMTNEEYIEFEQARQFAVERINELSEEEAEQLLAQNMELAGGNVADLYPEWEADKYYRAGTILKHGETQLWITIREVLSQAHYPPEADITAYKKITFTESGIPVWTQPLTYEDAYDVGDKVEHPQGSGVIWICEQGNANGQYGIRNTFEPGVWGWSN